MERTVEVKSLESKEIDYAKEYNNLAERVEKREYILKVKIVPNFIEKNKHNFKGFLELDFNNNTKKQIEDRLSSFISKYHKKIPILYNDRDIFAISENLIITNTISSVIAIAVDDENKEYIQILRDKIFNVEKLNEEDYIRMDRIQKKQQRIKSGVLTKKVEPKKNDFMVNEESFLLFETGVMPFIGEIYEDLICDLEFEIFNYTGNIFGHNACRKYDKNIQKLVSKMKEENRKLRMNNKKLGQVLGLNTVAKQDYCKMYNLVTYFDPSNIEKIDNEFVELKKDIEGIIDIMEDIEDYFFLSREDQLQLNNTYRKEIDIIQKALKEGKIEELTIDKDPLTAQFDIEI